MFSTLVPGEGALVALDPKETLLLSMCLTVAHAFQCECKRSEKEHTELAARALCAIDELLTKNDSLQLARMAEQFAVLAG